MEVESVHRSLQRAVRLPFRRLLPKILEPTLNAHGVRMNMSLRSLLRLLPRARPSCPATQQGTPFWMPPWQRSSAVLAQLNLNHEAFLRLLPARPKTPLFLPRRRPLILYHARALFEFEFDRRSYNRAWCGRGRGRRDITTPRSARDFTIAGQS